MKEIRGKRSWKLLIQDWLPGPHLIVKAQIQAAAVTEENEFTSGAGFRTLAISHNRLIQIFLKVCTLVIHVRELHFCWNKHRRKCCNPPTTYCKWLVKKNQTKPKPCEKPNLYEKLYLKILHLIIFLWYLATCSLPLFNLVNISIKRHWRPSWLILLTQLSMKTKQSNSL